MGCETILHIHHTHSDMISDSLRGTKFGPSPLWLMNTFEMSMTLEMRIAFETNTTFETSSAFLTNSVFEMRGAFRTNRTFGTSITLAMMTLERINSNCITFIRLRKTLDNCFKRLT